MPAIPHGWQYVPLEPTEEMWNAAWSTLSDNRFEDIHTRLSIGNIRVLFWAFHEAMLEAAPRPPLAKPLSDEQIKAMWIDNWDRLVSLEEATVIIRETEKSHGIMQALKEAK